MALLHFPIEMNLRNNLKEDAEMHSDDRERHIQPSMMSASDGDLNQSVIYGTQCVRLGEKEEIKLTSVLPVI